MDVWALGICLYYMLIRDHPPWIQTPDNRVTNVYDVRYQNICCYRNLGKYFAANGFQYSPAHDLLQNMLLDSPIFRYSTQQILDHPWLRD